MATRYNYTGGIVTDGLVLHLDAAKKDSYPGSGTTWYDLSGNGNDGTLTNGPTYSGVAKDAAVVFDGSNDHVRIPNSETLQFGTDSFTAMAWVYPSNDVNNVRIINNRGTGAGGSYKGYQLKIDDTGVDQWKYHDSAIDDASGTYKVAYSTNAYSINQWYLMTMVYETQTQLRLYVNTTLDIAVSVGSFGSITNTLPTAIGAAVANNGVEGTLSQTIGASISQVQVYNRALTASEITQNYNALKGRYGL